MSSFQSEPPERPQILPPQQPSQLVEYCFRHEAAGLVAVLTRSFGFALVDLVEDKVQDALLEALSLWRISGPPDRPVAWLYRVARNRIIDSLRRQRTQASALEHLSYSGEASSLGESARRSQGVAPDEIQDGLLRMLFVCCHPRLDRGSQLALSLKVLCGLGDPEIARGLLITPSAAKKRVLRAKQQLQAQAVSLDLPSPQELGARLDVVHEALYLMFNEGYLATRGALPVRVDLCEEAARLCHLLAESEWGSPATRALLALMLFHAARFESRMSDTGASVLLQDQDRSRWDRRMMQVAQQWCLRSAEGNIVSRFHLEAGIARLHCQAASIDETDWSSILRHYDLLQTHFPSPMVKLNRAIVLGRLGQTEEALAELRALAEEPSLATYAFYPCALADLYSRGGQAALAVAHWHRALELVQSAHERQSILARLHSEGM